MKYWGTFRYFLITFLPAIVIIGMIGYFFDQNQREQTLKNFIESQQRTVSSKIDFSMKYFFEPLLSDAYFLSNLPPLKQIGSADQVLDILKEEFFIFTKASNYYQIRVIDTTGHELIRVNFKDKKASIVPNNKLQDKSERDYFRKGMQLIKGQIYFSHINLNVEEGVIEYPYQPVLRIVAPITNSANVKTGLLVINFDMREFLKPPSSDQADELPENGDFYLLNANGYVLNDGLRIAPFGFMFDSLIDERFGNYYKEEWDSISKEKQGHLLTDQGLFVYKRFSFSEIVQHFNQRYGSNLTELGNNQKIYLLHTNRDKLAEVLTEHRPILYILLISIIVSFLAVWATISKINERRKDQELRKVLSEIRQSEQLLMIKNTQLESFIRIASHDLREPLATIKSLSQTLLKIEKGSISSQGKKYIKFIIDCAERMDGLTRAVLDYAVTGRTSKVSVVDCNEILDSIMNDLMSSIDKANAVIEYGEMPVIHGFRLELKQLFQNLISNAIKYGRPGIPPKITVTYQKKEKVHQFSVADNGIGIEEGDRQKIFKMFHRVLKKSEEDGLGIGLAISKKIVQLHHGEIWVEGNEEGGTIFLFTIKSLKLPL